MTDITEIKRELEALTAKVAKLEAERAAPRRNWPEKVEAGMVFYHKRGGFTYMSCSTDGENINNLVCVKSGQNYSFKNLFHGDEAEFEYLGHARDILTIRTDAHEPTGAELVGKVCQFTNGDGSAVGPIMMCIAYDASGHGPYKYQAETGSWLMGARLAP